MWKRYGHDRVYVNLADGSKVAWLDRKSGQITVVQEAYRAAVIEAFAPYVETQSTATRATRPSVSTARPPGPTAPPVPPEHDLATNAPGAALRARLNTSSLGSRVLARLLRRPLADESWLKGIKGEQIVGAELARFTSRGWRVLHSIPLGSETDIDHVLIGPGGVLCVNTKYHRMAKIWVGDNAVKVWGKFHPYVAASRNEAKKASAALTKACGVPVAVSPVLVFVKAASVTVVPTLTDVRVIRRHRDFAGALPTADLLAPDAVDRIYAAARDPRTWSSA